MKCSAESTDKLSCTDVPLMNARTYLMQTIHLLTEKQQGKIHSFCKLLPKRFLYSHKCWTVILRNRNEKNKNRKQKQTMAVTLSRCLYGDEAST